MRGRSRTSNAGRDLGLLLRSIHAANPTGRGLPAHLERLRYEQKATLQSELIFVHGSEVEVQWHDDMPGIVSLSVPRLGESAGHAVVAELSSWARDWIASRTPTPGPARGLRARAGSDAAPGAERASSSKRAAVGDLDRAALWIQAYDFECAEECLRRVLLSGAVISDRTLALERLLDLYVNHLGRDEDALELGRQHAGVTASPAVHRMLATAATRSGLLGCALDHLGQDEGPGSRVEIAAVFASALERRAWADVARSLVLLRRAALIGSADPAAGDAAQLKACEARARAALDEASALDLERDEALLDLVETVRPDHPALRARHVSSQLRRGREETERLLAKLFALPITSAGERGAAEVILRALASSPSVLEADERRRVARLSERLQRARAREAATELAKGAEEKPTEDAALLYLRMPTEARAAVRRLDRSSFFETVELLAALAGSDHGAARAALSWHHAKRAPSDRQAWDRIAACADLLARVPAFGPRMRRLRDAHRDSGAVVVEQARSGALEARSSSTTLISVLDEPAARAPDGESMILAQGLLHAYEGAWVVALHRAAPQVVEVWLRAIAGARAKRRIVLRIVGRGEWQPVAAICTGAEVHLVDAKAGHHVLLFDEIIDLVEGPVLAFHGSSQRLVVCSDRLVALEADAERPSSDHIVQGVSRPVLAVLRAPRIVLHDGARTRDCELPAGSRPFMVVESPCPDAPAPLLVERRSAREGALVWWQSPCGLWRAIQLAGPWRPPSAAFTLVRRGALVVARGDADHLLVDRLRVEGERLFLERAIAIARGIGVVVDGARRHAWSVALDERGSDLRIEPLSLRAEESQGAARPRNGARREATGP